MTALLRRFGFQPRYRGRHRRGVAQGSTGQRAPMWHELPTKEWPLVRSPVPVVEDGPA